MQGKENESTQEWMGRLYMKAAECNSKEHDRCFKEQFIKDIDNVQGTNVGPQSWDAEGTEKSIRCNKKHQKILTTYRGVEKPKKANKQHPESKTRS